MTPARALIIATLLVAQSVPAQQTLRDSATALFNAGDHRAAIPLLERVVTSDSTDSWSLESLGFPPVGIDPNGGDSLATPAQQAYDSVRAAWQGEAEHRHSLPEEAAALRAAFAAGGAEPRTRFIGDLDAAGMLEPFILFARADEGIAEDFPGYRAGNAQQLRLFLLEWFVGAGRNRPKPATQR